MDDEDRLMPAQKYRHEAVYIVGQDIEHQGLKYQLLPEYIIRMIDYMQKDDGLDQIIKSIVIHYYFAYYKAFTSITDNFRVSQILDVTPFVNYFIDHEMIKLQKKVEPTDVLQSFNDLLQSGEITAKEKDLFNYVLSAYGTHEFSTKQLEKDYKNAAYATIRNFVLKLENKGLLSSQRYGNKFAL